MSALSASELLAAWERGLGQRQADRALTLLAATHSRSPRDALAKLSIGRRDAGLFSLREEIFGPHLTGVADCPHCRERLELNFNTADIRESAATTAAEELSICVDKWQVKFRLPNSDDLLAITDGSQLGASRAQLLRQCILAVQRNGESRELDDVPANVIDATLQRMSQLDPLGDLQLAFNCPLCGYEWQAAFDIAAFLWTEINAWAHRTLREVDELARAYGWREADILAMSPLRRQVYLEMISQ